MEIEDKLLELKEGIHIVCDRIVYVKEINNIRMIRVFDLFDHNEENYFFDEVSCCFFRS